MGLECGKGSKQAMLDSLRTESQKGMDNTSLLLLTKFKEILKATSAMLEYSKLVFHQEEVPTVESAQPKQRKVTQT